MKIKNITLLKYTFLKYTFLKVVDDFRFYKEGVYSSDKCGNGPTDVNHAVLAVGYGTCKKVIMTEIKKK